MFYGRLVLSSLFLKIRCGTRGAHTHNKTQNQKRATIEQSRADAMPEIERKLNRVRASARVEAATISPSTVSIKNRVRRKDASKAQSKGYW